MSNLPIYFMSSFVIPRRVYCRLEKLQRDFPWGRRARHSESFYFEESSIRQMGLEVHVRRGALVEENNHW